MTEEKRKPKHELRLGSVKAAIWENRSEKTGTWYSVTLSRLYKQGDSWKRSESFGASDLPLVSKVVELAMAWIQTGGNRSASTEVDVANVSVV